jgi:hypothetical protein
MSRSDLCSGSHRLAGASRPATRLDESKTEVSHRFPWFLADGRHFLYCAVIGGQTHTNTHIGSLDSSDTKPLLEADSNAIYASGYLLYLRESDLMAQPFDPERLTTTGDPVLIAENVGHVFNRGAFGVFSASANGVLAYVDGGMAARGLTWLDRKRENVLVMSGIPAFSAASASRRMGRAPPYGSNSGATQISGFTISRAVRGGA